MKATIVTIGDEILIGQITDTNSAWLGDELTKLGIEVVSMMTISDKKEDIHRALELSVDSDLVVCTGGLGPTKDDITKKAIADYVGSDLVMDEALSQKIEAYFMRIGIPFLEAHREQCLMPEKAQSLTNEMGTAPGMLFKKGKRHILSMPGVPHEMKWIFHNSFAPLLDTLRETPLKIYHKTIKTVGRGESRIAEDIQDIVDELPPYISMSYLPSLGSVKLRLTARHAEDKTKEVDAFVSRIVKRIHFLVYGYDKTTLEESLRDMLIEKGLKVATAESCTGGFLAHRLTSVPGSSGYYMGSIIAYDYGPKKTLLGVTPATLESVGAVSEETVKEMLAGLFTRFEVDLGVAVSGIAGPGGALPDKPVGTIWMAWGSSTQVHTRKLTLTKNRIKNIEYTAVAAMNALRKFCLEA